MQAKYKKAILAGIGAGLIIVLLMIINSAVYLLVLKQAHDDGSYLYAFDDQPLSVALAGLVGYLLFPVYCFILLATGFWIVRRAVPDLTGIGDASAVAAVSGACGGLVWALGRIVSGPFVSYFTTSFVSPSTYYPYTIDNYPANFTIVSIVLGGIIDIVCCLPASIFIGIVAALIGGLAYAVLFPKKTTPQ